MKILDLRSMPAGTTLKADLAIVGAGPAGLTIARELAGTKIRVLVLESGGLDFDAEPQKLNEVENIGEPADRGVGKPGRGYSDDLSWLNEVPAFELRNRAVGGSTHTWVGKCAAFDEIDFARRAWLPGSGWPFDRRSLADALDRAAALLNLGPNIYDERLDGLLRSPPEKLGMDRGLLQPFFWQFSHSRERPGEPLRFRDEFAKTDAGNVETVINATVTRINAEKGGHGPILLQLRKLQGGHAIVEARAVALCAGGIENARLLLASGIGNQHDVVGRYLADHPRAVIARFGSTDASRVARHFSFFGLAEGQPTRFYLRGLALSPQLQEREALLNCAAYPVQELAEDDPWIAIKRFRRHGGLRHAVDALSSPGIITTGLYRRLVQKRGLPRKLTGLRFDSMVEQLPNPESRVTLSTRLDPLGVPLARVDWKISLQETKSIARLGEVIADEFRRLGLPQPRLADWIANDEPTAASFADMAHPAGTTRMGLDPATSVVDEDARVHGMEGLYVAGSSIFPTPGHANPTLMIVALSIRLADHLKDRLTGPSSLRIAVPETGRTIRNPFPAGS